MGLFGLSRSVLMSSVFYLQLRSGIAARAAALSFIYQKLSRLKSVGNKSVGEVRLPSIINDSNIIVLSSVCTGITLRIILPEVPGWVYHCLKHH